MHRLAFNSALIGAGLFACAAWTSLPSSVSAFELQTAPSADPYTGSSFGDPDERPLPAPLSPPRLEVDGTAAMANSDYAGNPANNPALIPAPATDTPFWSYSGAPMQRFGN
jgi:hypothetical protein